MKIISWELILSAPSRGGLEVERLLHIQLKVVTLALVGSNPSRDYDNDRSEAKRLCRKFQKLQNAG